MALFSVTTAKRVLIIGIATFAAWVWTNWRLIFFGIVLGVVGVWWWRRHHRPKPQYSGMGGWG